MGRHQTFAEPLTAELKQDKLRLVDSLASFWRNVGFKKNWTEPCFLYVDVKPQIDNVADTVVRIRSWARSKFPDARETPICGAAIEKLWSMHEKPSDLEQFETEMIKACLMDSEGYVAPLDEELVSKYIEEIRSSRELAKSECQISGELEALKLLLEEIRPTVDSDESVRSELLVKIQAVNSFMGEIAKKAMEEETEREKLRAEAAAAKEEEDENDSEESSSNDSDERNRMKQSMEHQQDRKLLEICKIGEKTSTIEKDVKAFEELDLKRLEDESLENSERQGLFKRLQKRALQYSVLLERELLALDAFQGEEIRPARKAQVLKIQQALQHVDKLQQELKKFHEEHEAELASKETEPEEQKQNQEQEQVQENEEPPKLIPESSQKSLLGRFASLKLEIDFQVRESRSGYSISAHVPNLDREHLKFVLSDDKDVLTCEGRRVPTEQEIEKMRIQLRQRYEYPPQEEDDLILRYGTGRFGSFQEKWRIDERSVDVNQIEASYENGNLEIFVPRIRPRVQQQQRGPTRRNHPAAGQKPFYW